MNNVVYEAFAAIVGTDNVTTAQTDGFVERYADPYSFDDDHSHTPPGAVSPSSTSEVQEIVREANRLGVGLWTVSRGKNLGYGGASPRRSTDWVLDLGRMNKILEINSKLGYAVVQPGVSFFDFADQLRKSGAPFMPSVPDLGYGSPIGNALERGFGYAAHGQHSQYLCGLEVVLPDGSVMRTGMGADADSAARFVYKGGFGPETNGLFHQSNLGIVTEAAIWLFPKPEQIASVLVSVPEVEDLAELVENVRPLQLDGTIDSVAIAGNIMAIASGAMPRSAIYDGEGPIPLEIVKGIAAKFGVGYWNSKFAVYGDKEIVAAKIAKIERTFASNLPNSKVQVTYYPGDVAPEEVHPPDRGQVAVPSGDLLQMAAWRGGTPAHTDFSVVCTTEGDQAQKLVDMIKKRVNEYGLDHAGGFTLFGRHAIMLTLIAFDASSQEDKELVKNLFGDLISDSAKEGFAPYRAHPAFMDQIMNLYDFGDHAHLKFINTIKDALDPNGILSVGKQGVWGSIN